MVVRKDKFIIKYRKKAGKKVKSLFFLRYEKFSDWIYDITKSL